MEAWNCRVSPARKEYTSPREQACDKLCLSASICISRASIINKHDEEEAQRAEILNDKRREARGESPAHKTTS
jgi:hypothetical protein